MIDNIKYLNEDIDKSTIHTNHSNHSLKIKENDILFINIITNNQEINDVFSLKSSGATSTMAFPDYNNGIAFYRGYKVNIDGKINIPFIGGIEAKDLSTGDFENILKIKFQELANEVNIVVKIGNFRVTILGDVQEPKSIIVPDEKITIFELLGLAGDINMTADLKEVIVIRETKGKTDKIKLDLTRASFINTDYYFLKQNDIIYIPPKNNKFIISNYSPYFGSILSGISIIFSLTTLLKK
jgi:polysaccharide export outer membrane protein